MQHGEKYGVLDIELEAASVQELLDDLLTAGLAPEPLEDEDRTDVPCGDGGELSLGVRRQDQDIATQSCAREQEPIELPGLLELVESPQGGDDALPRLPVDPAVLVDLKVGAWAGGPGAEEQGALVIEAP